MLVTHTSAGEAGLVDEQALRLERSDREAKSAAARSWRWSRPRRGPPCGRRRCRRYNTRDLMVEGSGFLQWLSVFALATDPDLDVLLLDEPDAHLHPSLQEQLLDSLRDVATATGKQMLRRPDRGRVGRRVPLVRLPGRARARPAAVHERHRAAEAAAAGDPSLPLRNRAPALPGSVRRLHLRLSSRAHRSLRDAHWRQHAC